MKKKVFSNCKTIFPKKDEVRRVEVASRDGRIEAIGEEFSEAEAQEKLDLGGNYLAPGFVDLQVNGGNGVDFLTCDRSELERAGSFWLSRGTTSFLGTVITQDIATMNEAIGNLLEADLPNLLGVHVEGPFLSTEKRGTHNRKHVKRPKKEYFDRIVRGYEEGIELFTFAPEVEGADELLDWIRSVGAVSSIGHSNASYEVARSFVERGVSSFTHLFNGMKGFHHRDPGTVGAALNSSCSVGVIADGLHLHPGAVQLAGKAKGANEVCLVTDAIAAAGMEDGRYVLGDQEITVENGLAKLENETIAGSTLTLDEAVMNYLEFAGATLPEAVSAVTVNPARLLGKSGEIGTLERGSRADFTVFDENLNVKYTIVNGEVLFDGEGRNQG